MQGTGEPDSSQLVQDALAKSNDPSSMHSTHLDRTQQWMKQQADAIADAVQIPALQVTSASQLSFLPGFMTQLAAEPQVGTDIDAAMEVAASSAQADNAYKPTATQADRQQAGAADTAAMQEPTSWLEWEQQLQVASVSSEGLLVLEQLEPLLLSLNGTVCMLRTT